MTAPVTKRVEFRGAARDALVAQEGEVLLAGPAGTGKSLGALFKLHAMAMRNGVDETHARGMQGLIVRKTHNSLTSTGLVTFKQHVAAEALERGIVRWYGGSGSEPPKFIYSNGSEIKVGGMDNPMRIMSSEYDLIFAQEATEFSVTDWESLTTRLRNGRTRIQQLLADCNPQGPDHWLKLRCDAGKTRMLYSRHEDNPMLFDADGTPTERGAAYLAKLATLTGVRKLRLLGGIWAAAEGIIYAEWDPARHFTDRKKLPQDWRRIWGIDFGYRNPFVWQMWAIDPDGNLWLEKEVYQTEMTVEEIWNTKIKPIVIAKNGEWKYPRPDWIVTDHDAEDRATFERHSGLRTIAAIKDVSPGIQAVQRRLAAGRMKICRDSLHERDSLLVEASLPIGFAGEVTGYVWKAKPSVSTSSQDKPTPDEPLKVNDHSMDTSRYVVAQLDLRNVPRARRLG